MSHEIVVISLRELNAVIDRADAALDGDSNDPDLYADFEHDTLYAIREQLAEYSKDPDRRDTKLGFHEDVMQRE